MKESIQSLEISKSLNFAAERFFACICLTISPGPCPGLFVPHCLHSLRVFCKRLGAHQASRFPSCFAVVVVAFDLSDVDTLAHARRWKEDACASASEPTVFLIGTKKDIMASAGVELQI